jgi:hypothetical protein
VDLRDIRIQRLERFASRHGVKENPSALGELIGKKPNQVYNLLHRQSSFGEKVARSIEEAAGLPRYWLDIDESQPPNGLSPDVLEVAMQINDLEPEERERVLTMCRELLKLAKRSAQERNVLKNGANEGTVKAA